MKMLFMKLIDILEIKKKINELWFRYIRANYVDDADECAYDYFWKQSSSNYIQFSFMIITLLLLF